MTSTEDQINAAARAAAASGAGDTGEIARPELNLIGKTIAGRYVIKRLLGQGGMGAVYVAEQQPIGREVAVKIVRGDMANEPRAVERFKREAKTLSQLTHPHIVSLYDFDQSPEGLFIAMELLPGTSLRERIVAQGRMLPAATIPIVRDISAALGAAHARGILHRDLKPDNVMLIESFGRRDFVKLLDFGIAKLVDKDGAKEKTQTSSLTQAGMLVGTPGYLAPEVVVDGVLDDPRSDLYALGVTWFEMITAQAPFTAATPVGLMMKHANERPPRTTDLVDGVPPLVADLLDELLAKDRRGRPGDAQAVLSRLEAIVSSGAGVGPAAAPKTQQFLAKPSGTVGAGGVAKTIDGTAPFLDRPMNTLETPAVTQVLPEMARLDLAPLADAGGSGGAGPNGMSASSPSSSSLQAPAKSRAPLIAAAVAVILVGTFAIVKAVGAKEEKPKQPDTPVAAVGAVVKPEPPPAVVEKPEAIAQPVSEAKPIVEVVTKPLPKKPVSTKSKPSEKPVADKLADKPAETKPAETKPADKKPVLLDSVPTKPDKKPIILN